MSNLSNTNPWVLAYQAEEARQNVFSKPTQSKAPIQKPQLKTGEKLWLYYGTPQLPIEDSTRFFFDLAFAGKIDVEIGYVWLLYFGEEKDNKGILSKQIQGRVTERFAFVVEGESFFDGIRTLMNEVAWKEAVARYERFFEKARV